jgi:hypothetical protein
MRGKPLQAITIAISIIALIISLRGCIISNEALDVSKSGIRPFVKIQPIKDKKQFMVLNKLDNGYELKLRFQTINKGKTPAIDIKPSYSIDLIAPKMPPVRRYIINTLEAFCLGPDESIITEFYLEMKSENYTKLKYIANEINNGSAIFNVEVVVPYNGIYERNKNYSTKIHMHVSRKKAELINSQQF